MPAQIPLEPPVTNATLPPNEFACVAAINILLVLAFCVLDSPVQNAIQEVYCQGVKLGHRILYEALSCVTH